MNDATAIYEEILAILRDPDRPPLRPEFVDKLLRLIDEPPNGTFPAHFVRDLGTESETVDTVANPDFLRLPATSPDIDKVPILAG
jgi:hypothetical protein